MEFKDVLKNLRIDDELSKQVLADSIGVTIHEYENYENGIDIPSEETINKLMEFFNVDRTFLFPVIDPEEERKEKKRLRVKLFKKVCITLLIVCLIIGSNSLVVLFINEDLRFNNKPSSEYADKTMNVDGYYIEIYERNIYHYKDGNNEEHTYFAGSFDRKDGELLWEDKCASGVVVYKRFGTIYSTKFKVTEKIILVNGKDLSYEDTVYFGELFYIKDNDGVYHYFYNRLAGINNSIEVWGKDITIEVNGVKQELIDSYYFTSKDNLFNDEYVISINGYEVQKTERDNY